MKKIFLAISVVATLISCKNENKKQVVGTNDEGKELIVNEAGDTIVYEPTSEDVEIIEDNKTENSAFQKNDDGMYNFSFNLKKGEKYPFNIKTTANNTQSDGKQSITVNQESVTEMEYAVKDVTAEGFVMDVKFKRFAEKMSDGKQSIEFDTNNATAPKDEAAKLRWEINKAIVGNSFNMTVDKNGKVQDISNLFKIRNNVKDKLKNNLKGEELAALDGFLNATLSDESMKQVFEESVAYYPKKAVKKGDTWNKEEAEGNAKSKVEYTFDGVEDGFAKISIKGTSNGSDSQTDPNGSGIKVFRTLKGTANGTVKIDEKSGWIKSAVMSKDETIAMTQQLNNQKSNFSSKTKSTTKINL